LECLRWLEAEGEPHCPKCGTLHYHTMSNNRFKCAAKACNLGHGLHARKLSPKKMLTGIRGSMGAPHEAARCDSICAGGHLLDAVVEIDGKYAGGHVALKTTPRIAIDHRLKK